MRKLYNKYKDWEARANKKLDKLFSPIDLKKQMPGYFHIWVFRSILILIGLIVLYDVVNYGLVSITLECDSESKCINPFYVCPEGYLWQIESPELPCNYERDKRVCDTIPCDKQYLEPGEQYGRTDFLSKYGKHLIFSLCFFAFILNHIIYMIRFKTYKYERGNHEI